MEKAEIEEINLKDDSWASLELKKKILGREHSLDEIIEINQIHEHITSQSWLPRTKQRRR